MKYSSSQCNSCGVCTTLYVSVECPISSLIGEWQLVKVDGALVGTANQEVQLHIRTYISQPNNMQIVFECARRCNCTFEPT